MSLRASLGLHRRFHLWRKYVFLQHVFISMPYLPLFSLVKDLLISFLAKTGERIVAFKAGVEEIRFQGAISRGACHAWTGEYFVHLLTSFVFEAINICNPFSACM